MIIKRSTLIGAIAVLCASPLTQAASPMPPPLSSYYPAIAPNANVVAEMRDGAGIALIGFLTPEVTASIRRLLDKDTRIKTLYIDSGGGELRDALALAELVRQRRLRVVVAGRCFSACANYVFTAARSKDVLPGSLVVIHGKTYHYTSKDKAIQMADTEQLIAASGDPLTRPQLAALSKDEHAFYANIGISTAYHDAFDRYTKLRAGKAPAGAAAGNCPAVDFWILRRKDMEKMGVTGMGAIWEPADRAAADSAATRLGLNPKTTFIGDPEALAAQCKPASGLMAKLRGLFG